MDCDGVGGGGCLAEQPQAVRLLFAVDDLERAVRLDSLRGGDMAVVGEGWDIFIVCNRGLAAVEETEN